MKQVDSGIREQLVAESKKDIQSKNIIYNQSIDQFLIAFYQYRFEMADGNCVTFIKDNVALILTHSARSLDSYGQYQQCLALGNAYQYIYIMLKKSNQPAYKESYVGLCLPSICDKRVIQNQANHFFQEVNISAIVKSITNSEHFYHRPFDWTFYLAFALSIFLIILFLLATFKKNIKSIQMFGYSSIKKTFQRDEKNNLNIFNGIKAISMIWIVLRHTFKFGFVGSINQHNRQGIYNNLFYLLIDAGLFAVDIFFFLGGFLVSYTAIKKISDWKSCLKAILNRAFRLWPAYIYSILFFYAFYLHLGEGPFWGKDLFKVQFCRYALKPLLFIDNFWQNGNFMCMGWTWYLQCDMQLFIISIGIIFVYKLSQKKAKKIIWAFIILGSICSFIWTMWLGTIVMIHSIDQTKWYPYLINQYIKPYGRFSPYMFGVYIGMLYLEYSDLKKQKRPQALLEKNNPYSFIQLQRTFKENRIFRLVTELSGIVIILIVMFIPVTLQLNFQWPLFVHALYLSSAKFLVVFGLFLTILPSILGCRQSFVSFSLDTNILNFIGKISFCTYLVQQIFIDAFFKGRKYDSYYSLTPKYVQFTALLMISLFVGMLITVLVQIPFGKIQTMILNSKSSKELNKLQVVYKVQQEQIKLQQIPQTRVN